MGSLPSRTCRHGSFWAVIVALAAVLGVSLMINLTAVGVLSGSAKPLLDQRGEDEFPSFSETHSYGAGTTKVVRIWFAGILARELHRACLGRRDPEQDCPR